mmetsp:Transcript_33209/g.56457  ORF Transcript_33209/g.56457 Transcript_33209/m.56457 type:complete len:171 (+) Transcript_33209:33-545(+)|eukprot:CAMPEP_0183724598 /NCGR_PEP_ID=MMETSP0737-20130205/18033_1 /TAXON_ID=385413 /ORGANISM="Thalassiosira miniscula, Strain CCMP1093" /LENGTH=170 /DNA_ID=CAMNT_0025955223 /DNA_START=27 /DNA_END=539 /DNA_ORIENTATION=+
MATHSITKILLFLNFLICIASPSLAAGDGVADVADPTQLDSTSSKTIQTLMCTSESCTDATKDTPGCMTYSTPLDTCYNAQTLFPNDESWSNLDIYDTIVMKNLKRTFYPSTDGSCAGRGGENDGGTNAPVDGDDSFIIPFDSCVGPFGPPRPWGKFTLLDDASYLLEEE